MCGGEKFKINSTGNKFEDADVCILCVIDHFCCYGPEKLSNEQKYNLGIYTEVQNRSYFYLLLKWPEVYCVFLVILPE